MNTDKQSPNSSSSLLISEEVKSSLFIVIAAFQEQTVIGDVVRALTCEGLHVIVVDDGSVDHTGKYAQDAGATVLRHLINRGQGAALQTGISYSLKQNAQYIVTFDADGQHDINDLPAMLDPILTGRAAFTLGSRFLGNSSEVPAFRKLILKAAVLFTRLFSQVQLTDAHNGFRVMNAESAQHIDIQLDRMAHASEIIDQLCHSGLPFEEVPITIRYTEYTLAKGQRSSNAIRVAADYLFNKLFS